MSVLNSRSNSYEKAGLAWTNKGYKTKVLFERIERLTAANTMVIASIIREEKDFLESLYPINTRFVNMRKKILDLIQYAESICTTN